MNRYPFGSTVTVTVPFVDGDGNDIVPTALSYRVLDQDDAVVQGVTALAAPTQGATSVTVTLGAGVNAMPAPTVNGNSQAAPAVQAVRGLREVELTMTTAGGPVVASASYILTANSGLVVLQNSFLTLNGALLVADAIPGLYAFPAASQQDQVAALSEAFVRLTRLGYRITWPRDPDSQSYLSWMDWGSGEISPRYWSIMSVERFQTYYPQAFRDALFRAQVAEADAILNPDPIAAKRLSGITLETIGQSTVQFKSASPINFGISEAAMRYLTGYLAIRMTTTRG